MIAYRIEATIAQDGTVTLDDLSFRVGESVQIIVLPQSSREQNTPNLNHPDLDADEWYAMSHHGLSGAYADDEPEYSLDHIAQWNPDYASR